MVLSQPLALFAEGAIRLPFLIMSYLSVWIWIRIMTPELSPQRLELFSYAAVLSPLWGLSGLIATPDIPLVFFWSLAIFFVGRVLKEDRWSNYFGVAVALGFAFLSKYQVVLFLPSLLLLLGLKKQWYKLFCLRGLVSILLALILCAPVLYWNYQNEWASFDFQWNHGMKSHHWHWGLPFEYLGAQIGLIFPTFLLFVLQAPKAAFSHWLSPFAIFPILFFLYSSFKSRVEANWAIMAYPSIYALSCLFTKESFLKWMKATTGLWLFLIVLVTAGLNQLPKSKLTEARKYDQVLEVAKNLTNDSSVSLLSNSYQMSGFLSFKLISLTCKLPKYGRRDHMDYLEACQNLPAHFYYFSENSHNPTIEKDFPGYKVIGDKKIDEIFRVIEVTRK